MRKNPPSAIGRHGTSPLRASRVFGIDIEKHQSVLSFGFSGYDFFGVGDGMYNNCRVREPRKALSGTFVIKAIMAISSISSTVAQVYRVIKSSECV